MSSIVGSSSVQQVRLQGLWSQDRVVIDIDATTTIQDLMTRAHASGKFGFPDEQRPVLKGRDLRQLPSSTTLISLDLSYDNRHIDHPVIHIVARNPDVEWPRKYNELNENYSKALDGTELSLLDRSSAEQTVHQEFEKKIHRELEYELEQLKAEVDKEFQSKLDQLPNREQFAAQYPTKEAYLAYLKSNAHAEYWKKLATAEFMNPSAALKAKIEAYVEKIRSSEGYLAWVSNDVKPTQWW